MFMQNGKDSLDISIHELESSDAKHEKLRLKYLCKLYEAMAHLYCDPYLFDLGELYI